MNLNFKIISFVVVFLIVASTQAQTVFHGDVKGKISSADGDVAATHVLNISTKKAAITDIDGFFEIKANLNDTLVFSAIQFKRKEMVVSASMLASALIYITLEPADNALNEVVVMPYNLSGDLTKDMKTQEVVVAATLGLPNAYVKKKTQTERNLAAATCFSCGNGMSIDPIINAITGRTKMLKERNNREKTYARTQRVRDFYVDSLYINDLKIPKEKIDDFMYFCEIDARFSQIVDTHDRIKIWEFLRKKSRVYRKNNDLETP